MVEFFFLVFIAPHPDGGIFYDASSLYATHSECQSAAKALDNVMTDNMPQGTDFRISCISSESIGQNQI